MIKSSSDTEKIIISGPNQFTGTTQIEELNQFVFTESTQPSLIIQRLEKLIQIIEAVPRYKRTEYYEEVCEVLELLKSRQENLYFAQSVFKDIILSQKQVFW